MKDVSKGYADINDFKADVAVQYLKSHKNKVGVETCVKLFKCIDLALNGTCEGLAQTIGNSSALNDIVMSALSDGITSVNAKANVPTFMKAKSKYRSVLGCSLKGGADPIPEPEDSVPVHAEVKSDDDDEYDDEDEILSAFNKFH
jgi:hypothetical protein